MVMAFCVCFVTATGGAGEGSGVQAEAAKITSSVASPFDEPRGTVKADTKWMRQCAGDVDSTVETVKRQLSTGDDALAGLRAAAPGWTFLESLEQLGERWEDLNRLLRDELGEAAENIRFNASAHDGNENWLTEMWHDITN
jgi:hypothetical protein